MYSVVTPEVQEKVRVKLGFGMAKVGCKGKTCYLQDPVIVQFTTWEEFSTLGEREKILSKDGLVFDNFLSFELKKIKNWTLDGLKIDQSKFTLNEYTDFPEVFIVDKNFCL